jgi:glucose/arabinose dehydrogenase
VAGSTTIRRFTYEPGQLEAAGPGVHVADLTSSLSGHWTRDLALSRDSTKLFVSIGSATNVSVESPPRATVQQMNLDGSGQITWASGLRNPVGLAINPVTGSVFTVVNERDGLGDELVPDYMAELLAGDFYGWPYAYLSPDRLDPRRTEGGVSEAPALAASTKTPAVLFQAHSAPLGIAFYDGDTFPGKYRNGAFVAFHGSWNRSSATGYKVVFVPFNSDGSPTGWYEDFLTGFLISSASPRAWGRPVDLLVLPDGSLLVSEDANGMIYRIQYHP